MADRVNGLMASGNTFKNKPVFDKGRLIDGSDVIHDTSKSISHSLSV
jgi:hypothetical protein